METFLYVAIIITSIGLVASVILQAGRWAGY
jgi:preprotein translocase subunit SecG